MSLPPAGPVAPAPPRPRPVGPRPAARTGPAATPPQSPSGLMWVCLGLLAASGVLGLIAWLGLVWGGVTIAAVGGTVVTGLVYRRRRRSGRTRGTGLGGPGRGPRGTGRFGGLFRRPGRSGTGPGRLGGARGAVGSRPGGGLRSRLPRVLGGTRGRAPQSGTPARRGGRFNPLNWGRRSTSTGSGSGGGGRKWTNPFRGGSKTPGGSSSGGGSSGGRPWSKAASRLNPFRKRSSSTAGSGGGAADRGGGRSPAAALAARLNPFRRRAKSATTDKAAKNTKSSPSPSGTTSWRSKFNLRNWRRRNITTSAAPTPPTKTAAPAEPAKATASPAPQPPPAAPRPTTTPPTPPPRPAEPRHSRTGDSRTGDSVTTTSPRPDPGAVEDMSLLEFGNSLRAGHDAVAEVAAHYEKLAAVAEDTQPVDSAIPDAIRTAAKFMREAESILGELPATFDRQHEADRERAENPRKSPAVEEKADSKNNRDHV